MKKIKNRISLLATLLLLGNISLGQDWSTYNFSVEGWRHNPHERSLSIDNVSKLSLKWRFPKKGSLEKLGMICATPSVVNGYVYFGTATFPAFYKLKPNGDLAWKFQLGSEDEKIRFQEMESQGLVPRGGVYSSALVTKDAVFFGSVKGTAYC
ncbi:MAG: hypothetical protein QNL65_11885, partial [Opitutales bacterium]